MFLKISPEFLAFSTLLFLFKVHKYWFPGVCTNPEIMAFGVMVSPIIRSTFYQAKIDENKFPELLNSIFNYISIKMAKNAKISLNSLTVEDRRMRIEDRRWELEDKR